LPKYLKSVIRGYQRSDSYFKKFLIKTEGYIFMFKDRAYWDRLLNETLRNRVEVNDLDFKEKVSENKDRFKEHINAMGNTVGGGLFVFGMSKFRKVELTDSEQSIIDFVTNIARDTQEPPLPVEVYRLNSEQGPLLCIHVNEGAKKPVFIKDRAPFGGASCHRRSGAQTVAMSVDDIRSLLAKDQGFNFDESPVEEAEMESLNKKRLQDSIRGFDAELPTSEKSLAALIDNKIVARISNRSVPTFAGLIVYGKDLQTFRKLNNASILVQWFEGKTRQLQNKSKLIVGNLPEQLEQCFELLKKENWTIPVFKGLKREDQVAYDERVLREIVTNCVVHRDYSRMHQPVKVDIFSDRIEIENPGGLLPGLTTTNILHKREWRNPSIASLLSRLNFGEMDGQGIDVVLGITRNIHAPAPHLQNLGQSFKVTLFAPKPFDEFTPDQKKSTVFVLILLDSFVDNETLRNVFDISSERASTLIKTMIEDGTLEPQSTSRKFAKYGLTRAFRSKLELG
jgi:ATP-dependent DNA helicase RecG